MTIDHASREPRDARDDPPPMGHGTTPGPPAASAPPYDLRPFVLAAVKLEGNSHAGTFSGRSFGEIVRIKFLLPTRPDAAWCRRVLGDLPYVIAYPGDLYKIQTG